MGVFAEVAASGHEQIVHGYDPVSGLRAIIAIHSTALGPALGGTRFFNYQSEADALTDVLRLSQGMTFKAAAAGLDLGGGKAVIIGDPRALKSERLWRAYGRLVDSLHGRYITAEDVGTDHYDMELIRRETPWVTGIPKAEGGSGDPSPATARGLLAALQAVSQHLWGTDDLSTRKVAVQGVGKVGYYFVEDLVQAGCEVLVGDVYEPAVERVVEDFGVKAVPPDEILSVACDVVSPCAMGAVLDSESIPRLQCPVVLGSANNQLGGDTHAEALAKQGILYAPDFVVNAGGLINVSEELRGYSVERAARNIDKIYHNLLSVLEAADERGVTPHQAAVTLAEERIGQIGSLRLRRRNGKDRN
ncbi:MAG: leucine dehydrogenase [Actinomycetota bacterium]|nr:leucine dehydrogenase [Actinomycetota bacterium]